MNEKNNMKNKLNYFRSFFILLFVCLFCSNLLIADDSSYGSAIETELYKISRDKVDRSIVAGTIFRDSIEIFNFGSSELDVSLSRSDSLSDVVDLEDFNGVINSKNSSVFYFMIKGKDVGDYNGDLKIGGGIDVLIPINVSVMDDNNNSLFLFETEFEKKVFRLNEDLQFNLKVNKLQKDDAYNVSFSYFLVNNNDSFLIDKEVVNIINSFQVLKNFQMPENVSEGDYVMKVFLEYGDLIIEDKSFVSLKKPFLQILVLGFIPMWVLILILAILFVGFVIFYFVRRHIEKMKKYKMHLDVKTIPKKKDDFLFLGHIAEKKIPAYLDPARLTTHCIVAGATGGGKSISAQVLIEEALMKNIAVVVFDPTAQWSGMLRKCTDKKMMSYYSKFGLKPTDAKGFKGNVRQVLNSRQLIDINRYVAPGQIQIFSLNKLDPKEMDIFVANVIRQIFRSDPKESPTLKVLLVFDEVHRLLSKFGGSGQGFLQVERACREFRKWGLGVMLVSQVLSDFVGEIKANISTEVQMRTRDEGDLNRIKTKYGEEFLQSLVKASVGVGMFVNPAYNHAQPYFVNFRPILHNTRRLSDEELEKYNKYNDVVDDMEYSIEQLEAEKADVFDLKMELKLVKDKIMSGNFSVVEIYLEGLKPRIEKAWSKIGKTPKKREIQLVSEEEIEKSVEEAKASRAKFEKENKKEEVEEKKEEEKLDEKQVSPMAFDNGLMFGSIKELKGILPELDDAVFKIHVNKNKHDIADWIIKNFPNQNGETLKGILDKQGIIKELENFGKGSVKADAKGNGKVDEKSTKSNVKNQNANEGNVKESVKRDVENQETDVVDKKLNAKDVKKVKKKVKKR